MGSPIRGRGWASPKPPKIVAQFDSFCPECEGEIDEGETIYYSEHHDAYVCSIGCK